MLCWHCKKKNYLPNNKVGFRDVCEICSFDLHVCKNCKYYSPGKPNDCSIIGTLPISDREKYNFCEDFFQKQDGEEKKISKKEASQRLFGEDTPSKSLESLFKD